MTDQTIAPLQGNFIVINYMHLDLSSTQLCLYGLFQIFLLTFGVRGFYTTYIVRIALQLTDIVMLLMC